METKVEKTHKEILDEAVEIKKEILRTTNELDKKLDLIRTLNIPITIGKFGMHLLGLILKEPAFNWGGIILSGISVSQCPIFFITKRERDMYKDALYQQEKTIGKYQEEYVQSLLREIENAKIEANVKPPLLNSIKIKKKSKSRGK